MYLPFSLNGLDRKVYEAIRASKGDLTGKQVHDALVAKDAKLNEMQSYAAYSSMESLERRGLITSYQVHPPEGVNGQPKKYFRPAGVEREMITQYGEAHGRISVAKAHGISLLDRILVRGLGGGKGRDE